MNSRRFTLSIDTTESTKTTAPKTNVSIDIGVPGDIDQTIESLEDAYLYSLDDLERVTRTGWDSRGEKPKKHGRSSMRRPTSSLPRSLAYLRDTMKNKHR